MEARTDLPSGSGRRELLRNAMWLGVGAALASTAGCGFVREKAHAVTGAVEPDCVPLPKDSDAARSAVHVLNRAAFGPKPGDVAQVAKMGVTGWIEEQLADTLPENPAATWRVDGLDVQQMQKDAPDLLDSQADEQLLTETQQAALLRAIYSTHQLRETLADFWTNHFNIYALKKDGRILLPVDTERVIRPHVLGTFRDMLFASAHSPAMLAYLDNQENKRGVANENYARELLELHTLGVRSGYTQKDIQEVARCFTGWTVQTGFRRGQYTYEPPLHDDRAKFIPFLNLTIAPGGGQNDAETVLEQLAVHPTTARFLARKLCRRYLGEAPPELVAKAANAFVKGKSDIRALLRPILLDGLRDPAVNQPVLKRPLDFVASACRVLSADTDGGVNLQKHLTMMGQPLYQWPMPDGFPEKTAAWTGSLLPRWNFALALVSNAIAGTTVDLTPPLTTANAHSDEAKLDTLLEMVYSRPHDAPELSTLREKVGEHIARARQSGLPEPTLLAEATGLLLCAPGFQWR